jgi:hypothetical protein
MNSRITDINKQIARLRNVKKVLLKIGDATPERGFIFVDDCINIHVHDLEGLQNARAFYRKHLGSWNDECQNIFGNSGGGVSARFANKDMPGVEILLATSVEKFPKELLPSEKCTIEVEEETEKHVRISCPVGG